MFGRAAAAIRIEARRKSNTLQGMQSAELSLHPLRENRQRNKPIGCRTLPGFFSSWLSRPPDVRYLQQHRLNCFRRK